MARKTTDGDRTPPAKYDDWLSHIFGRDEDEDLFDIDCDLGFPCSDEELAALFEHTMRCSGEDLKGFSDVQLGRGLNILFNNVHADFSVDLRNANLGADVLHRTLIAIKHLYSDCLAPRAPPVLGHISEGSNSPLEFICYMLWDITPLSYWKGSPMADVAYDAVLDVMEHALYTSNDACIESGLHGLGHTAYERPEPVAAIIKKFLNSGPHIRQELINYAKAAATGYIQ